MLDKLSHIALIVRDPSRTASLFADVFGAKTIRRTDDDGHDENFVQLGDTWFVLVKADVERSLTGDHIAFLVSPSTLAEVARKQNCYITCPIVTKKDGRLYNSSILLNRQGKIDGVFHKVQ